MGLPRLQTCCFVLDLKTGNIVMGCINAFLSFVMFTIMIVVASATGTEEAEEEKLVEEIPVIENIEAEAQATGAYAMSIILMLMFLTKLFFDLFFVYGVIAERAAIIKAYFVMFLVFFILSAFTFFINVANYGAGTIFMELFYIGVNIYCILLSHSYYKMLNEREEI